MFGPHSASGHAAFKAIAQHRALGFRLLPLCTAAMAIWCSGLLCGYILSLQPPRCRGRGCATVFSPRHLREVHREKMPEYAFRTVAVARSGEHAAGVGEMSESACAEGGGAVWGDPGCPEGPEVSEEDLNTLLRASPQVSGNVQKHGILPLNRWWPPEMHPPMERAVHSWLLKHTLGATGAAGGATPLPRSEPPPMARGCLIQIDPLYKTIFVRNQKVAGTSILLAMGNLCGPSRRTVAGLTANAPCFWTAEMLEDVGVRALGYDSLGALWQDYFVFGSIRNPYERAGSAYDYILDRRKRRTGYCRSPTFEEFAARPYGIGFQNQLYGCGDVGHDLQHVERQFKCLVDADGRLAVDHLIRVEAMEEDFAEALREINRLRPEGLPELEATLGRNQTGPLEKREKKQAQAAVRQDGGDRWSHHVAKYAACGPRCLGLIHEYYKEDFALLQYPAGNVTLPGLRHTGAS